MTCVQLVKLIFFISFARKKDLAGGWILNSYRTATEQTYLVLNPTGFCKTSIIAVVPKDWLPDGMEHPTAALFGGGRGGQEAQTGFN